MLRSAMNSAVGCWCNRCWRRRLLREFRVCLSCFCVQLGDLFCMLYSSWLIYRTSVIYRLGGYIHVSHSRNKHSVISNHLGNIRSPIHLHRRPFGLTPGQHVVHLVAQALRHHRHRLLIHRPRPRPRSMRCRHRTPSLALRLTTTAQRRQIPAQLMDSCTSTHRLQPLQIPQNVHQTLMTSQQPPGPVPRAPTIAPRPAQVPPKTQPPAPALALPHLLLDPRRLEQRAHLADRPGDILDRCVGPVSLGGVEDVSL